jgi:hypothetical protein
VDECPHKSIIRREAAMGVPLNGLYCLDCGAMVRRGAGVGAATEWIPTGTLMGNAQLSELRSRLAMEKDPPDNIRLDPTAPGYAAIASFTTDDESRRPDND